MAQNDQKTLTITVPCYNAQDYMEKCLTTLLTGAPRVEIIIIDDGSHDKTGQIADEWASRYPETIRVHHQENGGHGEGINQGLKLATGRYFKVVDSDDWLDETALQKVLDKLDALETTGGVDLMVCNYVYTHADPKDNTTIRYANVFPAGETPVSWNGIRGLNMTQYLTMHACIFSVRALRECGVVLPKHTFYEDDLFAYAPLPGRPVTAPGAQPGTVAFTAAPWLGVASGLLVAVAGAAVVWWAFRMPRLGARYAAPGTAARVLDRDSAWWDAQDAGEDPTLNGSTGDPGQPPTNARG